MVNVWVEKKERRGWMKAIVGRMFALIHYRPTSTVVSYFEQIVIRRRLDASINVIDGAASPEACSSFPTRRPAPFFSPPLLSSPLPPRELFNRWKTTISLRPR